MALIRECVYPVCRVQFLTDIIRTRPGDVVSKAWRKPPSDIEVVLWRQAVRSFPKAGYDIPQQFEAREWI